MAFVTMSKLLPVAARRVRRGIENRWNLLRSEAEGNHSLRRRQQRRERESVRVRESFQPFNGRVGFRRTAFERGQCDRRSLNAGICSKRFCAQLLQSLDAKGDSSKFRDGFKQAREWAFGFLGGLSRGLNRRSQLFRTAGAFSRGRSQFGYRVACLSSSGAQGLDLVSKIGDLSRRRSRFRASAFDCTTERLHLCGRVGIIWDCEGLRDRFPAGRRRGLPLPEWLAEAENNRQ